MSPHILGNYFDKVVEKNPNELFVLYSNDLENEA